MPVVDVGNAGLRAIYSVPARYQTGAVCLVIESGDQWQESD
jgi:hypothetical protein